MVVAQTKSTDQLRGTYSCKDNVLTCFFSHIHSTYCCLYLPTTIQPLFCQSAEHFPVSVVLSQKLQRLSDVILWSNKVLYGRTHATLHYVLVMADSWRGMWTSFSHLIYLLTVTQWSLPYCHLSWLPTSPNCWLINISQPISALCFNCP